MSAQRIPIRAGGAPPSDASPLGDLLQEARYLAWRVEVVDRLARDSARVLARLGGSEPDVGAPAWPL